MSDHQQTLQHIITHHLPQTDPNQIEVTPIATGKFNRSFFIATENQAWVLRIAPPRDAIFCFYEKEMMRQEPAIHALLQKNTSVPVANIIAFDDSLELINRDYMLMERLPGVPFTEAPSIDQNQVLFQVGQHLSQTHAQTASTYGYIGAHTPMPPQSNWCDAFVIMWHKLIDDIVSVGHYNLEESVFFRKLLEQYLHLFDRPVTSCLLHMDVWHQNILVDESGIVTGLIDWDRALWGDIEIEFAVLDYCGMSEPAFWEGYGQARDQSPEARVRQIFYLLYELQKYIVIRQGRHNDAQRARQYKQQVFQIVKQSFQ